jgi:hypothetical protein
LAVEATMLWHQKLEENDEVGEIKNATQKNG